ncbi:uncharacterized protein LOC131844880 [Achroia grisella]|uniref:uncharacterized protein LOC131844880 n=1 Tax=Achroia grisella TaxID=688607 RepID=UPI0027D2F24F|nr:uncharacterized protein LOC131844880 [Achroia grisella]
MMTDVDEIIDYIKSLRKGFDKDLFQSKIEDLAYIVDTTGLDYDDFHALFKIWLNLSIPISKWISLGVSLVPPDRVEDRTVEYSFRWLLANYENHTSFSRMGFLLDWLTVAMDCNYIDMTALDSGYELFYTLCTFEVLTAHVIKLIYTLTKPVDVTRRRVLEIIDYGKKQAKKNVYRQLQVLLGLFKSYRPECVPEDVPAMSIHTAFRKINVTLHTRFKRCQERRNHLSEERYHLLWTNPLSLERARNKKAEPLVPNMEFLNVSSKQYSDKEQIKNYLDFTEAGAVVRHRVARRGRRPARLRALLRRAAAGAALLALEPLHHRAFFAHDLHHVLSACFLDGSPHSYAEKQDLLHRIAVLQHTMLQGIPVITRFLAQFLPLWNEKDYFPEIMELVEWVSVDSPAQVLSIVNIFTKIYLRADPMEQCAVLNTLSNMYVNMVYASTKSRYHFMSLESFEENYSTVLPHVAESISDMCNKALQINPEDICAAYSGAQAFERAARAHVRRAAAARRPLSRRNGAAEPPPACRSAVAPPPRRLSLALALLSPSAALLDKFAGLIVLYKQIFKAMKATINMRKDDIYLNQMQTLGGYTFDLIHCLYSEEALSSRDSGIVFNDLNPQIVEKLESLMSDVNSMLSLRNHIALAPYTYIQLEAIDHRDADNKLWFDAIIDHEFSGLSELLKKSGVLD